MWAGLINYLSPWFAWGKDTWQGAWTRIVSKATGFWATVVMLAGIVVGLIQNSKDAFAWVTTKVANIAAPAIGVAPGEVVAWLNVGNTVFPLSETLGYLATWLALYVACKVGGFALGFIRGLLG